VPEVAEGEWRIVSEADAVVKYIYVKSRGI